MLEGEKSDHVDVRRDFFARRQVAIIVVAGVETKRKDAEMRIFSVMMHLECQKLLYESNELFACHQVAVGISLTLAPLLAINCEKISDFVRPLYETFQLITLSLSLSLHTCFDRVLPSRIPAENETWEQMVAVLVVFS